MILIHVFQIVAHWCLNQKHTPKAWDFYFSSFPYWKFLIFAILFLSVSLSKDWRTGADCQMLPPIRQITDISPLPPINEVSYCTALWLKLSLTLWRVEANRIREVRFIVLICGFKGVRYFRLSSFGIQFPYRNLVRFGIKEDKYGENLRHSLGSINLSSSRWSRHTNSYLQCTIETS